MNQPRDPGQRRRGRIGIGLAAIAILAGIAFARWVHPFLAVNAPVPAEVMIVEGWVPDYVLDAAAGEYTRGHYRCVFVSGLQGEPGKSRSGATSDAERAAREVCRRLHARGLRPAGVNVVTLGPHARQSRLAYRRMIGPGIPVGVISVPKNDYVPARWWASGAGIKKTLKDFAGWLKELLFGLRW